MGEYNSSAFIHYCTFDILYRKKTSNIFFLIVLYILLFAATDPRGLYLRFAGEE